MSTTIERGRVEQLDDLMLRDRGFATSVINDEVNTFDHVIAILCSVLPDMSESKAGKLAVQIHETGKAMVFHGTQEQCELYCEKIGQYGLRTDVEEL